MDKKFAFDNIALKHIRKLVLEIGPRPAGSLNETKAIYYAKEVMSDLGYKTNIVSFPFSPPKIIHVISLIIGTLLIFAGLYFNKFPFVSIWMPFIVVLLLEIDKKISAKYPKTGISQYLITEEPEEYHGPNLLICAHLDSARIIGYKNESLRWIYNHTLPIIQRVSFLITFSSIIVLAGMNFPIWYRYLIIAISLTVGCWIILSESVIKILNSEIYSPGANDNASGVGVLLALAEYYKTISQTKICPKFLLTGAEETGMHGSQYFVNKLNNTSSMVVINLDMVGTGKNLYYVKNEGLIFQQSTDKSINRLLESVATNIKPIAFTVRSGDYAPFVKKGIAAVSLQMGGSKDGELAYHSQFDTVELIDPVALELTGKTVVGLNERLLIQKSKKER